MRTTLVGFTLFVAAQMATAQQPQPPMDSTLAGITSRGRLLAQYDIAAWHGTDAVVALKPTEQGLNVSIAHAQRDGRWEVLFGRLTAAKDTFYVYYRALQAGSDSTFLASRVPTPEPLTGIECALAAGVVTALADLGPQTRPYNSYVIPATPNGVWVYLFPAQTDSRYFPHGRDFRYRLSHGGTRIEDKHQFHVTILDRPNPDPHAVAGMHSSFDSLPSESDVFLVLRRWPRLPELIATEHFHYQVHLDGSISWRPAKAP